MILLVVALIVIFGFVIWVAKLAGQSKQTSKSIGELMQEEQAEVLKHVEIANEVRRDTPVRGALQRVQDRWNRGDKSLRDRRTADSGGPGSIDRRDGATSGNP